MAQVQMMSNNHFWVLCDRNKVLDDFGNDVMTIVEVQV